jgi:membrane protein
MVWNWIKAAWHWVSTAAGTFGEHNLTDWAAALTYYGLLAFFPALIAIVSIVGLFGDPVSTTETVTKMVTEIGPDSVAGTFSDAIQNLTSNRSAAGVLLVGSVGLALFSASSYIGAFSRASQEIYGVKLDKPFYETRPIQVLWTTIMVLMATLIAMILVLTGPLLSAVADPLGIGEDAVSIWAIVKWPILLVLVVMLFAFLYWVTAPVKGAKFVWVTAGGLLAVTVWLIASALLALYVANFGSYDKTYGTLAGVIILLLWIYVTNVALLLGVELNADRQDRSRPR